MENYYIILFLLGILTGQAITIISHAYPIKKIKNYKKSKTNKKHETKTKKL